MENMYKKTRTDRYVLQKLITNAVCDWHKVVTSEGEYYEKDIVLIHQIQHFFLRKHKFEYFPGLLKPLQVSTTYMKEYQNPL